MLLVSILLCFRLGTSFFKISRSRTILLVLWHLLFCFFYVFYVVNVGGDANGYFYRASLDTVSFNVGTRFIDWLTYCLIQVNLPFIGCFFFYNGIGTVGLLAFDGILRKIKINNKRLRVIKNLFPLLPSISFWSAGIGKDAISFCAICLALWAVTANKKNNVLLTLAVVMMLLVRPHMAAIIVVAICLSIAFEKGVKPLTKSIVLIISLGATAVILPFAINYSGLSDDGSSSADSFQGYIEKRQGYNLEGGSSVDISSMSLPFQMFTYIFRPLPFEARSITTLFASIDNLVIFIIILYGGKHIRNKKLKYNGDNRKFMWIYSMSALVILSMTTANMGIAMRQKWMFVPVIIYLFLSAISLSKNNLVRRKSI